MSIPEEYRPFACREYFEDGWSAQGHFDEDSQTLVIVPLDRSYVASEISFFAIGRSGLGGIDFGFRIGHQGLWAYHPIDQEFQFMAPTVAALVEGWCSGKLSI
ncbi:hypothetical protein DES53_108131 [Roseimicrobium gellanilyticum]|uniref:SMI1/KNR4 family protein SUKH-1 n=1 Tax=Roseimicrobium gellanilyticum TaxID=748857 RepID=A0A366HFE3_9BACT|nr:hypothetical protein [Roseimicrobium gellanilyticum]RBP40424.1 hypothetical protein DES53_108131 [Roseimicrobium gellanilyticum]